MKLSSKIKQILSEGFCLQKYGINNWALTENQALLAIEKIKELNIAILGGDVCFRSNGIFQLNYDNWYVEKNSRRAKKIILIAVQLKQSNILRNIKIINMMRCFLY